MAVNQTTPSSHPAQDARMRTHANDGARPGATAVRQRDLLPFVAGLLGLAIAAAAAFVNLSAGRSFASIASDQLIGLAYVGAGTIAWARRPGNRIGPVILLAGLTWYIGSFQASDIAAVTAASFAFGWLVNMVVAYLLLAYPEGRLFSRAARVVFALIVVNTLVPVTARLLLVGTTGEYGCVCQNPFGILANEPLFDAVMLMTRLATILLAVAVVGLIVRRWRQASRAARRQLNFVLLAGAIGAAALASDIVVYATTQAYPALAQATMWTLVTARAAVPIGFLAGLLQMRMDRGLVSGLVMELSGAPSPERLREVLARTLHDPSLSVVYWSRSGRQFVDAEGRAVELDTGPGRRTRVVERDGEPLCALAYDPAVSGDPGLLDGVAAALSLALDRSRLESMVRAQASDARDLPTGAVTFLHADIEGSTALLERLGERYGDVLGEERRLLRQLCRVAGGREVDSRADEFFAVFSSGSSPVDAALGIQRRLRTQSWPDGVALKVRIGLHSGTPQTTDEGYVGVDVHIAARIGAAAHGGQVLLSGATADLVRETLPEGVSLRDLGEFELKGVSGTHRIFQLLALDLPTDFPTLGSSARFVAGSTAADEEG
jgi:class 3 adenylate cyclase